MPYFTAGTKIENAPLALENASLENALLALENASLENAP